MTGVELRRLRTAAGLTQKALAARLELNKNYLASLDRGEAPIRAVVALAVRSVTAAAPRRRTRGRHEG
jgi:transcriptional regulator with XRE-family HTH domain